jgi:hypothetical protein
MATPVAGILNPLTVVAPARAGGAVRSTGTEPPLSPHSRPQSRPEEQPNPCTAVQGFRHARSSTPSRIRTGDLRRERPS